MVRLGIRRLLGDAYDIDEVATRAEALDLVRDIGAFDLVVLDYSRDRNGSIGDLDATEAIRSLHKTAPGLPIIAYGAEPERHLATRAAQAGACCFVSRNADSNELAKAVKAAAAGDRFVDPAVPPPGKRGRLTRRQRQLLQLLADGKSTSFAAKQLELSEETVKTHTKNILTRLDANNRSQAIAIALRESLID
jgi:DNA-binding NarL/FixJ family response regulator